ncbi:hypothetical protein [Leptospira interrogans]|uniref:hypothetical protein n=1 Tax=Leptospira interrogans TaxID=173 RepID=UPI001CE3DFC2|nr:hypothetical protein [Leptospira interrogans]
MKEIQYNISYSEIPDALWEKTALLIPKEKANLQRGRNRVPVRIVKAGIIYRIKKAISGAQFPMRLDLVKLVTEDFKNGNE